MANKLYNETSVQAIADAIRSVNGSTDTYKIGDMAAAVAGISTGLDWSQIGYDTSGPNKGTPDEVVNAFNYAKNIKEGKNLFDTNSLTATGITVNGNVAYGTILSFYNAYKDENGGFPISIPFEENAQYTFSLKLKYENNSQTGNGIGFRVDYSDGTYAYLISPIPFSRTDYFTLSGTTASGKTATKISVVFVSVTSIIVYMKDIQLEKGSSATPYVPYCKYTNTSTYISNDKLFFWPSIDISGRYNYQNMFDKSNLLHCPPLTLGTNDPTAGNITTNYMFRQTWVEEIEMSTIENNTYKIYLTNTFYDCKHLKKVKFNCLTECSDGAFNGCVSLTDINFKTGSLAGSYRYLFRGCTSLVTLPDLVTASVATLATEMCKGCTLLENVPIYDFSTITNMQNAFQNCPALTDQSLDNILVMSINAAVFTGTKSLAYWGIANTYDSRITALPHYQDFLDAGWVIR